MSTRSDSPAKLGIQAFYSIRGVDDPADIVWKREEWDDLRPVSPPGLGDRRIFLAPCAFGKVFEGELAGIGVLGLVDLLQRRGNRLAVLVRDEGARMADEMDDAGLHLGLRKDSGDRLRKALQAVDDGDQHVLDAAAFQLVHHPEPKLMVGALACGERERYNAFIQARQPGSWCPTPRRCSACRAGGRTPLSPGSLTRH